jgi:hypothetical protein
MAEQIDRDFDAEPSGGTVVARGVKIAGEAVLAPGASLLLDGKVLEGGTHLLGAMVARWALGPIGWLLVAGNSYCKSVTGEHLHQALFRKTRELRPTHPVEAPASST